MNRRYGSLTAPDIATHLGSESVLCLPFGSYEQHGPIYPCIPTRSLRKASTDCGPLCQRALIAAMSVRVPRLCLDFEHLSSGKPGSQSLDEVSYCAPTIWMDPHVPTHSVEPPDLRPFQVDARFPR